MTGPADPGRPRPEAEGMHALDGVRIYATRDGWRRKDDHHFAVQCGHPAIGEEHEHSSRPVDHRRCRAQRGARRPRASAPGTRGLFRVERREGRQGRR
ncbi:hypothetical protein FRAHR75_270056 [Frankia sp. Hr75.2]|nr:hypothetical protein FRAHR75_270056 [Frankia sp. Hr75.2]SQD96839.1 hypothetical protein FMEAI12_3780003 [Parafrankia sp. Ea1.12]